MDWNLEINLHSEVCKNHFWVDCLVETSLWGYCHAYDLGCKEPPFVHSDGHARRHARSKASSARTTP